MIIDAAQGLFETNEIDASQNLLQTNHFIRYGVGERFEFNAAVNYGWFWEHYDDDTGRFARRNDRPWEGILANCVIGFRTALSTGENGGLAWGLQGGVDIAQYIELPSGGSPVFNLGTALSQDVGFQQLRFNLAAEVSPGNYSGIAVGLGDRFVFDKFGFQVDANYSANLFNQFFIFDGGLFYRLSDDVQLDIFGGVVKYQDDEILEKFVNLGISWRLHSY